MAPSYVRACFPQAKALAGVMMMLPTLGRSSQIDEESTPSSPLRKSPAAMAIQHVSSSPKAAEHTPSRLVSASPARGTASVGQTSKTNHKDVAREDTAKTPPGSSQEGKVWAAANMFVDSPGKTPAVSARKLGDSPVKNNGASVGARWPPLKPVDQQKPGDQAGANETTRPSKRSMPLTPKDGASAKSGSSGKGRSMPLPPFGTATSGNGGKGKGKHCLSSSAAVAADAGLPAAATTPKGTGVGNTMPQPPATAKGNMEPQGSLALPSAVNLTLPQKMPQLPPQQPIAQLSSSVANARSKFQSNPAPFKPNERESLRTLRTGALAKSGVRNPATSAIPATKPEVLNAASSTPTKSVARNPATSATPLPGSGPDDELTVQSIARSKLAKGQISHEEHAHIMKMHSLIATSVSSGGKRATILLDAEVGESKTDKYPAKAKLKTNAKASSEPKIDLLSNIIEM